MQCCIRAAAFLPFSFFRIRESKAAAAPPKVQVALTKLKEAWSVVEIEFTKQIKTHRGLKLSTFPGYIIRLPDAVGQQLQMKQNLYAVSRICPHEGCQINFYRDQASVPFRFRLEQENFANPMLVCSCHQSHFDPAQGGKVLSGPAPRSPWTFDFIVQNGRVIIQDLEPGGEMWG